MRFFDRTEEIASLKDILELSKSNVQFMVMTGRRRIGSWRERKGENEIDIVAENELDDETVFIEVKRKEDNFDAEAFSEKICAFTHATGKFKDYTISKKVLSMTDLLYTTKHYKTTKFI